MYPFSSGAGGSEGEGGKGPKPTNMIWVQKLKNNKQADGKTCENCENCEN